VRDDRVFLPTTQELSKMALAEERAKMIDECGGLAARGLIDRTDGNAEFEVTDPHD
jgi:hypothetical protein